MTRSMSPDNVPYEAQVEWQDPFGSDEPAVRREALRIAWRDFRRAIVRDGIKAQDIAARGQARMFEDSLRHPGVRRFTPAWLTICTYWGGVDLLREDGRPGGLRLPRAPSIEGPFPEEAAVLRDLESQQRVRRSLRESAPRVIPISTANRHDQDQHCVDPPAAGAGALPEDEALAPMEWAALPDQLHRYFVVERVRHSHVAPWTDRVEFSQLCGEIGMAVAERAAQNEQFRRDYERYPMGGFCQVIREVAPQAFPECDGETLQSIRHAGPRRRAYRMVETVRAKIAELRREDPAA